MAYTFNHKFHFGQPVEWEEGEDKKAFTSSLKLLKWIYGLRLQNGGDLRPDWDVRVLTKICEQTPYKGCKEVSGDVKRIDLSDISRFYRAMLSWKAHDGKLVPQSVAESRAAICVECPMNVPIVGCFGCANALPIVLKAIGKASTSHDANLKGCGVCGCALKAKVHMPEGVMTASAKDGDLYPSHCWIAAQIS